VSERRRVKVELGGPVAEVMLDRGDKHNGLDHAMFEQLAAAQDELASNPGIRAVVLHGDGPSFCAGLDFASFMAEKRPIEEMLSRRDGEIANFAQRASYGWQQLEVPVIAALHGNCLGGGCQIALAADIRIAGPDLGMSVLEVKWGLIPDMGLTRSLPRLVGIDVAKELTWTGRIVDAEEALRLGLVTRVAERPREAAHELAKQIAARSPDAIRRAKRLYEESWTAPAAETLALEEALQRELIGSPNQAEAVRAALSGSEPEFVDPS
jgi:enoyl-CoA hydratase/carnithine racemase